MEKNTNCTSKIKTFKNLQQISYSTRISFNKFWQIQVFLIPTRTMEQKKLLTKPFKQTFLITDIKHNTIEIPFIIKYIPTLNILNSKVQKRQE